MIPMIEEEVVDRHKWLGKEDFIDLMSLSQTLPGIFAVNFSIYIGHRLKGMRGSIALASGVILPSFLCILLVAMFFTTIASNPVVEAFFKGVRPAAVALIAAPCFTLGRSAHITLANVWFPIAVGLAIALAGISPIYIIIAVGVGAFVYGRYFK